MRITRIFAGDDGESHFEDLDVPLRDHGPSGSMSELVKATGVIFRQTGPAYDRHNAPRRQFVVNLSGGQVELKASDGTRRRFGPGDVLLAEHVTGRGHVGRAISDLPRDCLFITLD